ncbi:hypothetical protein [Kaistella pullorum]|uniref:T9SS C-terminal target domain-containing protein n=1 Tax=Kaistella pullorum TaxID=2763074 RepID=A0ABR8WMC8_9FLAO|nr:hypothetical protein [Kaistella pullorum]MBD8018097.1 hypothetical protein [Kaistella pullorum]
MYRLFIFSFLFLLQSFTAQQTRFFKLKKYETAAFSDTLKENSGLSFFNGKLYTINDGGNSSEIFEIDPKYAKIKSSFQTSVKNVDWEAIASDSVSLYVGDVGNNAGTRKDLKIYKFAADSLRTSGYQPKIISYYYPEQTDFTRRIINNDYDAEAMIFLNGKIHIFTKEWASRATSHYIIDPTLKFSQPAQKTESYNTGFVVTDAEYYEGKLYLIGYTKSTEVYLMVFEETQPGMFFGGPVRKYYLGSSVTLGQIEGIAADDHGLYISGEEFRHPMGKVKPRLYFVPHEKLR